MKKGDSNNNLNFTVSENFGVKDFQMTELTEETLPKELLSSIARRGKWTVEEEKYAEQIIGIYLTELIWKKMLIIVLLKILSDDFDQGVLNVPGLFSD